MKNTSSIIRSSRNAKKMTQTDMALNLDCSSQFFHAVEKGRSTLPPRMVGPVCSLLNIQERVLVSAMVDDYRERLLQDIQSTTHT